MPRPTLSLVLPIFKEEEVIPELDRQLRSMLENIGESWEVVFVNDGSKDRSHEMLDGLAAQEPRYKLVSLSRNFGHQIAITAGTDHARGEAVVVMDADLQDPPEIVVEMLQKWREGFDVVYGVRSTRLGESIFKRATAAAFYRLMRSMVGIDLPVDVGDFRLMSRRVVLALRTLRETHRFVRGLVVWIGFRQTSVQYMRPGRFAGVTKYPLRKMLRFALDGITSFSVVPLKLSTYFGAIAGLGTIGLALWTLWVRFFVKAVVPGWTSLLLAVAMISTAQFVMIGILGEYVGRIYEAVKGRPLYIVGDRVNVQRDNDDDDEDQGAARSAAGRPVVIAAELAPESRSPSEPQPQRLEKA